MFTGLIEEIGRMKHLAHKGQSMILTIEAVRIIEDVRIGDSIAVNGVCLTVVGFDNASISVDVMPETYRRTNLKLLHPGSRVNLERAMAANGRYGGHLVQGHVDTVGTISSRYNEENAVVFGIQPSETSHLKYMISQGSITVDGISLTIVSTAEDSFTVSIIPHTLAQTVLKDKQPGDTVNLECDILGKYIDHLLHYRDKGESRTQRQSKLTENFLSEHGFM